MNSNKRQEQRLDFLLEAFLADSDRYQNLKRPNNIREKENLLRSLMNIHAPKNGDDK